MTSQTDNTCSGCYYYDSRHGHCGKNDSRVYEHKTQKPICWVDPRSK